MTVHIYADNFNIISPPKGLEEIMPYKVRLELADPDDEYLLDMSPEERTFTIPDLQKAIRDTSFELADEMPDGYDPGGHPDIKIMRKALQMLDTKSQSPVNLSSIGLG